MTARGSARARLRIHRTTVPDDRPGRPWRPGREDEGLRIVAACCDVCGVPLGLALSTDRHEEVVMVRHLSAYLMRKRLCYSFPAIARILGRADHTTVMSSVATIDVFVNDLPSRKLEVFGPRYGEAIRVRISKIEALLDDKTFMAKAAHHAEESLSDASDTTPPLPGEEP